MKRVSFRIWKPLHLLSYPFLPGSYRTKRGILTWLREKRKISYLFSNFSYLIPANDLYLVSKHLYIILGIAFHYTLELRILTHLYIPTLGRKYKNETKSINGLYFRIYIKTQKQTKKEM